jgi:REP element-mobilizing transposase RayT
MPRKPRIDFPGAWHHVMHRGDRRAPIFVKDEDCGLFLDLVGSMVEVHEIEVHAYSLMPNHYHLLVRSRHGNLSEGMRHLNASYTQQLNLRHRWDGPIFRGRFHSQPIRNELNLPYVLAYIHLNPIRANLVTRVDADCWTSHRAYLNRCKIEEWLSRDYFLELFNGSEELHKYVLDLRRKGNNWPEEMELENGWLKEPEDVARNHGQGNFETRFVEPTEVIDEVCAIAGVSKKALKRVKYGPRANPARRFAVVALRKWTRLTHAEIAKLLGMTTVQVANVLRRYKGSNHPLKSWIDALDDGLYNN